MGQSPLFAAYVQFVVVGLFDALYTASIVEHRKRSGTNTNGGLEVTWLKASLAHIKVFFSF
jgi:hypothetical protein